MDALSSETKARLQQVADLMLDIYKTRAEMRFIDAAAIKPGPHDITHLIPLYESLKLDPAIVYLYSILPYVDEVEAGPIEFYMGGTWFNQLNKEQVRAGRDPLCRDPKGRDLSDPTAPYMRPWYTPLSAMDLPRQVIIYDARADQIWTIDHRSRKNEDPGLQSSRALMRALGVRYNLGDESDTTDSEDEAVPNDFSQVPARTAVEVLGDINQWFRTHRVPFEIDLDWADDDRFGGPLVALYTRHGWPRKFDGDAFEVGLLRRWATGSVKREDGELARLLAKAQWNVDFCRQRIKLYDHVAVASRTTKGKWVAKYESVRASQDLQLGLKEAKQAEDNIARRNLGTGSDVLEVKECRVLLHRLENRQEALGMSGEGMAMNLETVRRMRAEARQKKKEDAILVKAIEAAKADVARLFPGVDFNLYNSKEKPSVKAAERDHAWTAILIESLESKVAAFQEFDAKVPGLQRDLKRVIKDEISKNKTLVELSQDENERLAYRINMRRG
ncbi:hypothetical protein PG988_007902 [Apiospora saccharicola]